MDDKNNKKSFDIGVDVNRLLGKQYASIYQGRTPAWRKFFQSWARQVLKQDYFETLVNHRLSTTAFLILKENPMLNRQDKDLDVFLKGVAHGIEMLYGDIKQASTKQETKEEN